MTDLFFRRYLGIYLSTKYNKSISTGMQLSNKFLLLSLLANIVLIGSVFFIVQRLGGLTYMIHRLNNKDIAGIYEHRKEYFNMLPKKKGGIIFLGDSLTEYGQWTELTQSNQVLNRGIAGDTTPNLMRRLNHIIDLAPKKIFLGRTYPIPSYIYKVYCLLTLR